MNTAQRRNEILKLLHQAEKPVAARALASQFGVSRQVIVQDMAVIRASKYQHQPQSLWTCQCRNGYPIQTGCQ